MAQAILHHLGILAWAPQSCSSVARPRGCHAPQLTVLPLPTSCCHLSTFLFLCPWGSHVSSEPQLSRLQCEDPDSVYLRGLLCGLKELIFTGNTVQCLAHSTHLLSVR